MRLTFHRNTLLTFLNVVALVIIFAYAAKDYFIPLATEYFYKEAYKELVFKCDSVMKEHFIAKTRLLHSPSPDTINELRAAEVGLLTCHDYDVLRKKLIRYGLNENDLSRLGLETLEERAQDVRPFVDSHEIRY